jgi:hypothetical protein
MDANLKMIDKNKHEMWVNCYWDLDNEYVTKLQEIDTNYYKKIDLANEEMNNGFISAEQKCGCAFPDEIKRILYGTEGGHSEEISQGFEAGPITVIEENGAIMSNETVLLAKINEEIEAGPITVIEENGTLMSNETVPDDDIGRGKWVLAKTNKEIAKYEKIRDDANRDAISKESGINFKIDYVDLGEFRESMEKFLNNPKFIYTEHEARKELDPRYKWQDAINKLDVLYKFKRDLEQYLWGHKDFTVPAPAEPDTPKPEPSGVPPGISRKPVA